MRRTARTEPHSWKTAATTTKNHVICADHPSSRILRTLNALLPGSTGAHTQAEAGKVVCLGGEWGVGSGEITNWGTDRKFMANHPQLEWLTTDVQIEIALKFPSLKKYSHSQNYACWGRMLWPGCKLIGTIVRRTRRYMKGISFHIWKFDFFNPSGFLFTLSL